MSKTERGCRINPADFKAFGFPLGGAALEVSRFSNTPETARGIVATREALQEGGVVFLDYHASLADIVIVAMQSAHYFRIDSLIAPFAAKHLKGRFVHYLGEQMEAAGAEVHRVFRQDELKIVHEQYGGDFEKAFGVTREQRKAENKEFAKRAGEMVHEPHSAMIVAPFGTRHKNLTPDSLIGGEVATLLQSGVAAVCTYAEASKIPPFYRIHISEEVMRFGQESSKRDLTATITSEFEKLQSRSERR